MNIYLNDMNYINRQIKNHNKNKNPDGSKLLSI